MPDWNEPQEIKQDLQIFIKIVLVTLGVYGWEFLTSLQHDYDLIISRRRDIKLAQILYLVCRYFGVGFYIGLTIAMNAPQYIDCQAIYIFNQVILGFALGSASTLFTLRTAAIWSFNKYIMYPLCILSLGHWAIILRDIIVTHAIWFQPMETCAVDSIYNYWLAAMFIYTMAMDTISLTLASIGLVIHLPADSPISNALRREGLVYFLIASFANAMPVAVTFTDLNAPMRFIFTCPAICANVIAATRAVRRLGAFNLSDASSSTPTEPDNNNDNRAMTTNEYGCGTRLTLDDMTAMSMSVSMSISVPPRQYPHEWKFGKEEGGRERDVEKGVEALDR